MCSHMFMCLSQFYPNIIFAELAYKMNHNVWWKNELPGSTLYYETFYFSN